MKFVVNILNVISFWKVFNAIRTPGKTFTGLFGHVHSSQMTIGDFVSNGISLAIVFPGKKYVSQHENILCSFPISAIITQHRFCVSFVVMTSQLLTQTVLTSFYHSADATCVWCREGKSHQPPLSWCLLEACTKK